MKLFLQKNAKFSSAPPLRISGYTSVSSYKQKSEISHLLVGKRPSKNKGARGSKISRSNEPHRNQTWVGWDERVS